jgi:hypothetical protein
MEQLKEKIQVALDRTKIRLAELDWSKEFIEMINDSDYTCLKYYHIGIFVTTIAMFDPEGLYKTTKDRWRVIKDTRPEEAKVMEVDWREIERLLRELRNMEMTALREKWDAEEDDCRKPYLLCEDCNNFYYSETAKTEHECEVDDEDRTTECKYCKKKCGTYERLETHLKSKHHTKYLCKECEFPTNSKAVWETHLRKKTHRENCGIVKEVKTYPCPDCDVKPYTFPSELQRHSRTCKGKKDKKI